MVFLLGIFSGSHAADFFEKLLKIGHVFYADGLRGAAYGGARFDQPLRLCNPDGQKIIMDRLADLRFEFSVEIVIVQLKQGFDGLAGDGMGIVVVEIQLKPVNKNVDPRRIRICAFVGIIPTEHDEYLSQAEACKFAAPLQALEKDPVDLCERLKVFIGNAQLAVLGEKEILGVALPILPHGGPVGVEQIRAQRLDPA